MIEKIGWLLVHSIWQFSLWALVALLLLRCLRRASASVRYSSFVCILLLMTLSPVITWAFLPAASPTVAETKVASGPVVTGDIPPAGDPHFEPDPFHDPKRLPNLTTESERDSTTGETGRTAIDDHTGHAGSHDDEPGEVTTWSHTIHQALAPWLDGIVGIWFAGMLLFSLRPLSGWYTIRRLSTKETSAVPEDLLKLLRETAERLGVTKTVRIFQSSLATVPLVTGFLRPVILLPTSVVTGLPPAQLQAILAHELAHIRRYDQLVNLWQTLVETIFFYHPLVWWLSHQIRCERENCCDDVAVSVTGGKVAYGRALLALDELRGASSVLALSSHGGALSSRIRRLVTGEERDYRSRFLGLVAFLVLFIGLGACFAWWNAEPQPVASTNETQEPPMSAEELAAWDALGEIEGLFSHDLIHRRHFKRHLRTLERYPYPEETLSHYRNELERPVRFADFMHVPEEAWPHIVKLESLRRLSITSTDVRGRPMEWISQMKNLESVKIDFGQCVPADLVHLKHLPNLERIEVGITVLGKSKDDWLHQRGELTEAEQAKLNELLIPKPPANRRLNQELVIVALHTDRAIRALSELKKLRSLKLRNSFATDASLESLANCPELEVLELSILNTPQEAPKSIGEISALHSFSQSPADNETLQELSTLADLEKLDVWADGVTSEGVPHLLKLKNLKRLEIRGHRLDDAGLIQLAELPKLEYLDIKYAKGPLSLAGVLAFQQKKPDCRLEVDDELPLVAAEETKPNKTTKQDEENIPFLERKVSLVIQQLPLREALQMVGERANVEIVIDEPHLKQANLDLDQPVDVEFENLILGEVLSELIDWQVHPGVFRDVRGGKLVLTTLAAERERVRNHIPDWLQPMLGNGMVARLDENNEVDELYFGNKLTDELLAKLTTLTRLRKLDIEVTGQLSAAGIKHLAELKGLQELNLYGDLEADVPGDEILHQLTSLKQLRELSIGQCGITDEGLKVLVQMPQLTSLRINNEGLLTDDCLSSIATLKHLQSLSMSSYVSTSRYGWMRFGSEALAQLSALRKLEELDLAGQRFPTDAFEFTKLKSLSVSGYQIDDEFAKKLKLCPNLRTLHFSNTQITDDGLKQIAELPELRNLNLFGDLVTDEGLRALQNAARLEHLSLRNLSISDAGIGHLAQVNTLSRIDLHACSQTTVDGLEQLKTLPKLRTLYLTGFPDQTGYRKLSELKHLRELSFLMCGILYEDWMWLKTAMPQTQIHHMTGGGGFSMGERSLPKTKVKLPRLPEELQREEEQQPTIPFKQQEQDPQEDPMEEEEAIIPPRPRDPADVDAPLRLQVSRKNPPNWAAPCDGNTPWLKQLPAFLPDNTFITVGGDSSQLDIHDPKDGSILRTLPAGGRKLHSLRISDDGRSVAYISRPPFDPSDPTRVDFSALVVVRKLPSLELVGTPIECWIVWNETLALSSNGKFVAFSNAKNPNGVTVWEVESGKQVKEFPDWIDSIHSMAFSLDGRWLVISSLGDLILWEWQTEKPPQTIHVGRHTWSLAFSSDSRYLFEGPDTRRDIQVRDLNTMKVVRRLKDDTGHSMSVKNMQLTDGGKTLVAGNATGFNWRKVIVNDRLHFWDIETGKILRKFDFTRHEVYCVAVSPDGRYLIAVLWDLDEVLIAGWDLTKMEANKPD